MQVKFRDDLGNLSYLWFELFDRDGVPAAIKDYDAPQENPIYARLKNVLSDTVARDPLRTSCNCTCRVCAS